LANERSYYDKENQIWASLFMGKVCYLARHPLSP
jgi:hypothetical protein